MRVRRHGRDLKLLIIVSVFTKRAECRTWEEYFHVALSLMNKWSSPREKYKRNSRDMCNELSLKVSQAVKANLLLFTIHMSIHLSRSIIITPSLDRRPVQRAPVRTRVNLIPHQALLRVCRRRLPAKRGIKFHLQRAGMGLLG